MFNNLPTIGFDSLLEINRSFFLTIESVACLVTIAARIATRDGNLFRETKASQERLGGGKSLGLQRNPLTRIRKNSAVVVAPAAPLRKSSSKIHRAQPRGQLDTVQVSRRSGRGRNCSAMKNSPLWEPAS
jgi:hypothetical protein